jgi:hypothetical protein
MKETIEESFELGAKSDAAKEYWFAEFQKETIELLTKKFTEKILYYEDLAEANIKNEYSNRKFTYKSIGIKESLKEVREIFKK